MYSELYGKTKLKAQFDPVWDSVRSTVQAKDRLKMWNDFVRTSWEKETEEVKEHVKQEAEAEHKKALADWNKRTEFSDTAEGYHE